MSGPRGQEVGANLGQLYSKAKNELENVSSEIDAAKSTLYFTQFLSPVTRDASLGLGYNGPYDEWATAKSALQRRLGDLHSTLEACQANLILTVRDMARVDGETRDAFLAHGGDLDEVVL